MKKIILTSFILCATGFAATAQVAWVSQGAGLKNDYAHSIAKAGNGDVFATGKFQDSVWFGNVRLIDTYGTYCARFDFSTGQCLWAQKNMGGDKVISDGNNFLYLFDETSLDFKKVDFNGNTRWTKTACTNSVFGSNGILGADVNGNELYITGYFSGDAYFPGDTLVNNGGWDIFIAKFDTSGQFVWARSAGSANLDKGYDVHIGNNNNVYATGYFSDTVNFSGHQLNGQGSKDMYIVKYTPNGDLVWAKSFGGTGFDLAADIVSGSNNDVYFTGRFNSTITFGSVTLTGPGDEAFLLKTDTAGTVMWAKNISGAGNDEEGDIDYANGRLCFIATTAGAVTLDTLVRPGIGSLDICLGEVDTSGNALWMKIFGGTSDDEGAGITYSNSAICFATSFKSTASFGSFQDTAVMWDALVGKLLPLTTSVAAHEKNAGISIYPVPASGEVYVEFPPSTGNVKIELFDVNGQVVLEKNADNPTKTAIDVSALPGGIYFVRCRSGEQLLCTRKIIVTH